jgi:NAD(P)-dependent dehydrogenase (short-subunit alcohol dehydrogenase family)
MKDFTDKVVVITGGATGIGYALAEQSASRGARIVLAARRRNRLNEAAEKLAHTGAQVRVFECDVTDRDQVVALADFAEAEFGQVVVIVNNASVGPIFDSVIEADPEDVRSILDINLFGAWNGVSVFGKRFVAQGTPSAIFTVGSENSFFPAAPNGAGYVASKHAVLAMMVSLREEAPENIEVGLVIPGRRPVRTRPGHRKGNGHRRLRQPGPEADRSR